MCVRVFVYAPWVPLRVRCQALGPFVEAQVLPASVPEHAAHFDRHGPVRCSRPLRFVYSFLLWWCQWPLLISHASIFLG